VNRLVTAKHHMQHTMGIAWAENGHYGNSNDSASNIAGPSKPAIMEPRRRIKARKPFISADYKPVEYDGIFRVVVITSGSVASVKLPLIVGELSKVCMHLCHLGQEAD
jgi:hypothetical protein